MAKQVVEVEDQLENFVWDADGDSADFFGVKSETVTKKPAKEDEQEEEVVTKEKKDALSKEEDPPKKEVKSEDDTKEDDSKEEEEVKEEHEFFSEETTETKEDDPEQDDLFFNNLAGGLKEKGVFTSIELDEKNPLDEETFVESFETEINSRVEETFQGFFDEMDEEGKAFLKFKKEGGNTNDFLKTIQPKAELPGGDITEDNVQDAYLRYYYRNIERVEEEDIQDKIDWLEEGGKKEKYAKKYKGIIDSVNKQKEQDLLDRQAEQRRVQEEEKKEFQNSLKTAIKETEEVKSFPFTKKDKSELFNYITKPAVKVGGNRFITQFQKDLQEKSNNLESLLLLAKLVKSDFDIGDLEKKVETKQTINLKKKLQGQKVTRKPSSTGGGLKKSLSDFF